MRSPKFLRYIGKWMKWMWRGNTDGLKPWKSFTSSASSNLTWYSDVFLVGSGLCNLKRKIRNWNWAGLPSTDWPSCCCLGSLPCLLAWVRDVLLMTNSIYLINIYPFPCIFTIHIHHFFIIIHFIHHHSFSPISHHFHTHCQGRQEDYIVHLYYYKDGQRLFVASRGRFRYQRKRFQITVKVAANISEN